MTFTNFILYVISVNIECVHHYIKCSVREISLKSVVIFHMVYMFIEWPNRSIYEDIKFNITVYSAQLVTVFFILRRWDNLSNFYQTYRLCEHLLHVHVAIKKNMM